MATYQQQKQQILQLFDKAIAFAKFHKYSDTVKHLQAGSKNLAEGKLFVVVAGEFKQGKSSLLNAFLNEQGLFPVDIEVTTNLVTTITYGKEEKITVVLGEKDQETVKQIKRDEIADYVTEQRNKKNQKQAKMLVIESPNPQLKEGLILVDTPGIGSLNTEHTAITYAFVPNADAILFVTDAQKPLTTDELNFLKNRILVHTPNVIFVVTKIDILSKTDQPAFLENNRQKLAETLGLAAAKITLIPVSSRAKLDYLEYEELADLKNSNFEELEQQVWQLISEQRGQLFLLRALNELAQCVGEMKSPLQIANETHQNRTKAELDSLESQIQETRQHLGELLQNNAEWRAFLNNGLQEIQLEIQGQFQEDFSRIRYQANEYLDDTRLIESPKQIASLVETDIDVLMTNIGKQLNNESSELYARIETLTKINLTRFDVTLSDRKKANLVKEKVDVKKSSILEKSMNATRNSIFNSSAGSILGGILGAVGGAVVGFFAGGVGAIPGAMAGAQWGSALGAIGGAAKGVKDGFSQVQEKDQALLKREVSKVIDVFIQDSLRICQTTLTKAIKTLETSMQDQFINQIKRQKEGWEKTLNSLQESRKLSQVKAVEQSQKLQVPLQQLTQMQKEIEELMELIMKISVETNPQEIVKQPVTNTTTNNTDYGDWADE